MNVAQKYADSIGQENPAARDELITQYLPYVKSIVQRIAVHLPASVEIDDLINAGVIGLIQAIDRYDPGRGNKLITYAAFRIRGAVLSELRSRDMLSRSKRRRVREVETAVAKLEQQLGRGAEDDEVAEALGIDLQELYEVRQMAATGFVSLEELGFTTEQSKQKLREHYFGGGTDDSLTLIRLKEFQEGLAEAIEALPEREKRVVSLYYLEELTMKETAEVLGVTESRISQIHSQAVRRLRGMLKKLELLEEVEPS